MPQEQMQRTIIPAEPGWFIVSCWWDEKGNLNDGGVVLDPVIAWEITRTEGPYHHSAGRPGETWVLHRIDPITIDGQPSFTSNAIWAIKSPQGRCTIQDDQDFCSERAFSDHCKRVAETRRQTLQKA